MSLSYQTRNIELEVSETEIKKILGIFHLGLGSHMLGRTQNVTLPTSLASRKLLRVSITMMQLQRNEKEKKHHREAPVIIKYVEDRFSERSKKKKRKSNTTKEISAG